MEEAFRDLVSYYNYERPTWRGPRCRVILPGRASRPRARHRSPEASLKLPPASRLDAIEATILQVLDAGVGARRDFDENQCMEGFTGWVAGISLVVGLVYVGLSLRWGRTNASQNTAAIWARTLLNALLFFYVFMAALPWLAHWLLPAPLPLAQPFRTIGGGLLFGLGMVGWLTCLDAFSRRGRGTPSPLDAPRHLVTSGLFRVVRNPIIASEVLVMWGIAPLRRELGCRDLRRPRHARRASHRGSRRGARASQALRRRVRGLLSDGAPLAAPAARWRRSHDEGHREHGLTADRPRRQTRAVAAARGTGGGPGARGGTVGSGRAQRRWLLALRDCQRKRASSCRDPRCRVMRSGWRSNGWMTAKAHL